MLHNTTSILQRYHNRKKSLHPPAGPNALAPATQPAPSLQEQVKEPAKRQEEMSEPQLVPPPSLPTVKDGRQRERKASSLMQEWPRVQGEHRFRAP
jgi:hypothetical protein